MAITTSCDRIAIRWTPPAVGDEIVAYILFWEDNIVRLPNDVLDYIIPGLDPDKMYTITLRAVSRNGADKEYKRSVRTDQFCKYC